MMKGGILPAGLVIFLAWVPSNIVSIDEFPWPDFPCTTPTLARPVGGATGPFLPEAGTIAGTHCLACVF